MTFAELERSRYLRYAGAEEVGLWREVEKRTKNEELLCQDWKAREDNALSADPAPP
jgi:hypothetical protein